LKTFDLKTYALAGAEARVREITAELEAIYRVFPALRRAGKAQAPAAAPASRAKRRRAMSAAERKAVSARMKKYWANRRKAAEK
jgi:hypothetical protein